MKLLALLSAFVVFTSADCTSSLTSFADLLGDPNDKKVKTRCANGAESFANEIADVVTECGADDKYLSIFLEIAQDTLCATRKIKKNRNKAPEIRYCLVPLLGLFDFTGVVSAVTGATGGPSGAAITEFFKTYDWSSYPPSHEAKVCSVPRCTLFLERVIIGEARTLVDKDILDPEAIGILTNVLDGLRNCGTRGCRRKWPTFWADGKLVKSEACRTDGRLKPCAMRRMMFNSINQEVDPNICSEFATATDAVTLIDDAAKVVVRLPNFLWSHYQKTTTDKPAIKADLVTDALAASNQAAFDLGKNTTLLLSKQISLNIAEDTQSPGVLITMTVTTTSSDVDLGGLAFLGQWLEENPLDEINFYNMDTTMPISAFANKLPFTMHSATVVSVETYFVDDGVPPKKPEDSGAETGYACSSVLVAVLGCLALY